MAKLSSRPLPTPAEIIREFPINGVHRMAERRRKVNEIIAGTDKRLLMIVGPCSAWPLESMEEYAQAIARVQEQIQDRVLCVLRAYIQKPRTRLGWKGPMVQPDPLEKGDLVAGIRECRSMMHKVGQILPLADEMLNTHNAVYFEDALSYIAIGARSTNDQEHRGFASMFDCAVGVKNSDSGSIEDGVNGVEVAQDSHTITAANLEGRLHEVVTSGNSYAHLVLRGGKINGRSQSNYDRESLRQSSALLRQKDRKIQNPAIIVDASHENSGKVAANQPGVVRSVLRGIVARDEHHADVRGFMVEGHLEAGNQKIAQGMNPRKSITDDCMGLPETIALLREVADSYDKTV